MTTPKIEKSTVECYKMFGLRHGGWAVFTIDDQGDRGRIQIASDFGDYQNYWNACGMPFKRFLTKINIDYAADKFRADEWFDADKTEQTCKETILSYRRDGSISKEKARDLWRQLKQVDFSGKSGYSFSIYEADELFSFFHHDPPFCYDVSPQFKRFWQECWLPLMEVFKKENSVVKDMALQPG